MKLKLTETNELQAFHRFISDKLSNGGVALSPEDALDEWRDLHRDPEIDDEEVAAIQEALTDMAQGDRGRPADVVLKELRSQFGIPQ